VVKWLNLEHPGGMYIYRVHDQKIKAFCKKDPELMKLGNFISSLFDSCPHENFNKGPRGSSLKFRTEHDILELYGHQVSILAKYGLEANKDRFKSNHSKVQLFMLENDRNTVAIEVPIWMNSDELGGFKSLFGSNEPLSGHIDVLGIDEENIWVWDYKPNANKERYASTQVYFYALMLSKRTGIPLERFRCGYFDWERAYVFKPEPIENKRIINGCLKDY